MLVKKLQLNSIKKPALCRFFNLWCVGLDSNQRYPMGGRFTVSCNSRLFLALPPLRVGSSERLLFGERKKSSPQLDLLLVPSKSAFRTTPLLVFICSVVVSLLLFDSLPSNGEEFVYALGRS